MAQRDMDPRRKAWKKILKDVDIFKAEDMVDDLALENKTLASLYTRPTHISYQCLIRMRCTGFHEKTAAAEIVQMMHEGGIPIQSKKPSFNDTNLLGIAINKEYWDIVVYLCNIPTLSISKNDWHAALFATPYMKDPVSVQIFQERINHILTNFFVTRQLDPTKLRLAVYRLAYTDESIPIIKTISEVILDSHSNAELDIYVFPYTNYMPKVFQFAIEGYGESMYVKCRQNSALQARIGIRIGLTLSPAQVDKCDYWTPALHSIVNQALHRSIYVILMSMRRFLLARPFKSGHYALSEEMWIHIFSFIPRQITFKTYTGLNATVTLW